MFIIAAEENYEKGQVIFEEGFHGKWVYVVLSGTVELSRKRQGKKIVIALVKVGEVFGEMDFISGLKRSATAVALENSCVGVLDGGFLEKEYNQLSGDFRVLIQSMAGRFHDMLNRFVSLEERAAPRYPKVLSLSFRDRATFVQVCTSNLSAGGLFLKTDRPLPEGHRFMLKLHVPGRQAPVQIESEVARVTTAADAGPDQPPGMGIRFISPSEEHRKLLDDYLAEADEIC